MAFMLNRGEKGVRERIGALAACGRKKRAAAVTALMAAFVLCGCAFTGTARDAANGTEKPEEQLTSGEDKGTAAVGEDVGNAKDMEDLDKVPENAEKFTTVR